MTQALAAATARTLRALEDVRIVHLHKTAPTSGDLPENERITHVQCRREYVGRVPWRVCVACRYHRWTRYDTVKRPIVTCCVRGSNEETETYNTEAP
jgi:hypothetical protein